MLTLQYIQKFCWYISTQRKLQIFRVYPGIQNAPGFAGNGAKTRQPWVTLSILINVGGIQK